MTHKPPECTHCGTNKDVRLVYGRVIYPHMKRLWKRQYWECGCGAYVGCHGLTDRPLGRPANKALREARLVVHQRFDRLWKRGYMSRSAAYKALAEAMGLTKDQCHIGLFDIDQCRTAWKIAGRLLDEREHHEQ